MDNSIDRSGPQFPHPYNGATSDSWGCAAGEMTPRTVPGPREAQEGTCCLWRPLGRGSYRSSAPWSEEKPAAEGRSLGARRPLRPGRPCLLPPGPARETRAGSEPDAAGCPQGRRRALGRPGWRRRRVQRARPERPRPGTRLQPARARARLPALGAPQPQPRGPAHAPPPPLALRAPRARHSGPRERAQTDPTFARRGRRRRGVQAGPAGRHRGAEPARDPPASPRPAVLRTEGAQGAGGAGQGRGRGRLAAGSRAFTWDEHLLRALHRSLLLLPTTPKTGIISSCT